VRLKGLSQLKNHMISSGIESANFPACSILPQATTVHPSIRQSDFLTFLAVILICGKLFPHSYPEEAPCRGVKGRT
jgi:hypothetical protein